MLGFQPIPGGRWETLGAVTASSRGTLLTASGTPNVKGTAVSLGTPGFPYRQVVVCFHAASGAANFTVDIHVGDPASAGWAICPDLRLPAIAAQNWGGACYKLPIIVGTGTALFARCSASIFSSTMAVTVHGCSAGQQGVPGFSRLVSLYTPVTSKGAAWTSSGTANADSGFTQLTSGVSQRVGGVIACIAGDAAANNNYVLRLAQGPTGQQAPLLGGCFLVEGGAGVSSMPNIYGPDGCDVAASTAFWVAGQTSISSRTLDIALWGFVA